jgi:hypothetical protein
MTEPGRRRLNVENGVDPAEKTHLKLYLKLCLKHGGTE